MAKLLSNQHAEELPRIFEAVRNMDLPTRGRPIRRDRGIGGGGGGSQEYIKITTATDAENYIIDVLTSPGDLTVKESGATAKILGALGVALEVDQLLWANFSETDGIYYIDAILAG